MGKPKSYRVRDLAREEKQRRLDDAPPIASPGTVRPQTRADCETGPRPCPWVGCRYHLYLDARATGTLKMLFGDDVDALYEMPETCALDSASKGPHPYEYLAEAHNMTRQRVQVIEQEALAKLAAYLESQGLSAGDTGPTPTPASAFAFDVEMP